MTTAEPLGPDVAALTGVRSGKRSFYRAYRRSDERLERTVEAMDAISRALVRTVEGPRGVLEEIARTAAHHLQADWVLLGLVDGALPGALPRMMIIDAELQVRTDTEGLPVPIDRLAATLRRGRPDLSDGWIGTPMTLGNTEVGYLLALPSPADLSEPADLSVLGILANLAAVSLHTSQQYQAGQQMHRQARELYAQADLRTRELAERTAELNQAQERLTLAQQRELLDAERHRIARELHDSVTQVVLSAGMSLELVRGSLSDPDFDPGLAARSLESAKQLCGQAVEQLRRAIYALHQPHHETVASLPDLLNEVAAHHRPGLDVRVRMVGTPCPIPADASHELARAVGEALFNVSAHAEATRAVIRLRYGPQDLLVAVADDGKGRAADLTEALARSRESVVDGRHRGLANIESRVAELGGEVRFSQSRIGGPRLEMHLPLPLRVGPGVISGLVGPHQPADRSRS
ncbi:GAF domain-containing sensor histidine kinase [Naumannella halotolerans]|uniref:Signal transduction histidine kinase n=1 Tax=Naumannella halotolerans TaxID=993414 RepID=A0A4R7JAD3_9ACTN|nr:histidine kinase [Naumannella halotolerans]TDT33349.1 signal transduction histidine kinase [Naumannella halotolerans]